LRGHPHLERQGLSRRVGAGGEGIHGRLSPWRSFLPLRAPEASASGAGGGVSCRPLVRPPAERPSVPAASTAARCGRPGRSAAWRRHLRKPTPALRGLPLRAPEASASGARGGVSAGGERGPAPPMWCDSANTVAAHADVIPARAGIHVTSQRGAGGRSCEGMRAQPRFDCEQALASLHWVLACAGMTRVGRARRRRQYCAPRFTVFGIRLYQECLLASRLVPGQQLGDASRRPLRCAWR
jgi:hypothetical protein